MNRQERRRREKLARKSAAESPADAVAQYSLAVALENQGKINEAIDCYRSALNINPNHTDAHNNLGNALKSLGNLVEAKACYSRAVEIDPRYEMAHYNLGNMLQDEGKLDEAIACYQRALEIDPSDVDTYNNLGNTLKSQGKLTEAIASYRVVVSIDPKHALGHLNLGNALKDLKKLDEAIDCYRLTVKIDPKNAAAHNQLGLALKDQGKTGKEKGVISKDKGKISEAVECFRRVIAISPNESGVHHNLGDLLRDQGKLDEAIDSYHRAIEIDPNNSHVHNNLGNALKEKDNERLDRAMVCYQRALEIDPNHGEARLNYGKGHTFFPGDPELEKLTALLERDGFSEDKRNQVIFALGDAHDQIGNYDEAWAYFSRGNEDMATRVEYDAARHRNTKLEIIRAFEEKPNSLHEHSESAEQIPIFVFGMSRSGKTLVESLLSQHGDVCGAGEKQEWIRAMNKVLAKYHITEWFPKCMDFLSDKQIREMGKKYMKDISKYSPQSRFFINTLPGNNRYLPLMLRAFPLVKFIYCHRDSLDQCLLNYFKRYGDGNLHSYDLKTVAPYHVDYKDLMEHWQRLYEDRIFTVRYEELVQNPEGIGARIYEYCGIDYSPTAIRCAFTADEIGYSKHYERYLGPLREALGELAR